MPIRAESSREEEAGRRVMDERLRIARELHDVVAHHIAVVSVHAGAADHVLRNEPDRVWPVLGHIRTAADTVLEEIKSVISVLRDPDEVHSTEPAPGVERLQDLLAGLRTMGFAVQHQQYGQPRSLPAVVNLAAYRIVQEALTNAHRYGDGDATFDLGYTADSVCIDVTNRIAGAGSRRSGSSGFGLLGMRERAAAAHGTITAGPVAGNLFRVEATRRIGADERLAGVRVLVLTTFDNDDNVIYALQAGASGFLGKNVAPSDLVNAIRVVADGEALLSPRATSGLVSRLIHHVQPPLTDVPELALVTDREKEILLLVAHGLSNMDIAERLYLSPLTVRPTSTVR